MNNKFNKYNRLFFLTVTGLLFLLKLSFAQNNTLDFKNNPEWIKMIGDPNINYYEAVKAYEIYWENHNKPEGEEEELEMNGRPANSEKMNDQQKRELEEYEKEKADELKRDSTKMLSEIELLELENKREMKYQCKRFEQWKREVKPFVQNDGRILSPQEQMDIYNREQEELRK